MTDNGTFAVSESHGQPHVNLTSGALEGFDVEPGDRVRVHVDGDTLTLKRDECHHPQLELIGLGVYQCQQCDEQFEMGDGEGGDAA